ncbi:hypothetical protein [Pedobacter nototheniae]|uniref:hypothetical protein n=1 Tax=Pedobacter nototheniae TaxID=2488994 RepID=UPI00103C3D3F|nr:hypothetical protein [Pedobacter nototheniae]
MIKLIYSKLKSLSLFIVLFFAFFLQVHARQWAVSTNSSGGCLLDRNGNNISCVASPACKYVNTGVSRNTSHYTVCDFYFIICFSSHEQYYTEYNYNTECPLDDYTPLLLVGFGCLGFVVLNKKSVSQT